jgi:hypothetical protein
VRLFTRNGKQPRKSNAQNLYEDLLPFQLEEDRIDTAFPRLLDLQCSSSQKQTIFLKRQWLQSKPASFTEQFPASPLFNQPSRLSGTRGKENKV